MVIQIVKGLLFLPVWCMQYFIRRDRNCWIFGAWDGMRYSDNSRAMFEYVIARHPEIKALWITESDAVFRKLAAQGLPVAMTMTWAGRKAMMRASVFFLSEGRFDGDLRFMNGIRFINLWHGMPLKMIGEDGMKFIRKKNLSKKIRTGIRKIIFPYEFFQGETLSTSSFFTPFLCSAFELPACRVWEVGLPRNDHFFRPCKEPLIEEIDRKYNRPVKILYMPTFRDKATRSGKTFNPFEQAGFDQKELEEVLDRQNMVLLYKGHYVDRLSTGLQDSRIMTVTDDHYDDMYTFIKDVDVLLTDYSSIYFDFLLLRKPVILFPFDREEYCTQSRPFYFDYELLEAVKVYDWAQLTALLDRRGYVPPSEEEVKRFHCYSDGNACQRLMQRLLSK